MPPDASGAGSVDAGSRREADRPSPMPPTASFAEAAAESRLPGSPELPSQPPPWAVATGEMQLGLASFYGPGFEGLPTANGERFDPMAMTMAHRTLPFGTWVRVTHEDNGRSVVLRVNDRGPFKPGRIADLSMAAARYLGMVQSGLATVRLEILGRIRPAADALGLGPGKPTAGDAGSGDAARRSTRPQSPPARPPSAAAAAPTPAPTPAQKPAPAPAPRSPMR